MDLINQIKTMKTIKNLSKTLTSFVILHDINTAYTFGDNFVGLAENIYIQGNKEEFFTNDNLKKIYNDISFEIKNNNGDFYAKISE